MLGIQGGMNHVADLMQQLQPGVTFLQFIQLFTHAKYLSRTAAVMERQKGPKDWPKETPKPKTQRSPKHQNLRKRSAIFWSLRLGVSLGFGVWDLGFRKPHARLFVLRRSSFQLRHPLFVLRWTLFVLRWALLSLISSLRSQLWTLLPLSHAPAPSSCPLRLLRCPLLPQSETLFVLRRALRSTQFPKM